MHSTSAESASGIGAVLWGIVGPSVPRRLTESDRIPGISIHGVLVAASKIEDAFHPTNSRTDKDVLGIDAGITLSSAEKFS
jgi:hypothetical protein